MILRRPRVPTGAKGVKEAYITANAELRLVRPLKFSLSRGTLGETKVSC